jgi:hypothetical protein
VANPPAIHLIPPESAVPAGCSGSLSAPGASPGNLCVFAQFLFNAEFGGSFDPASEKPEPPAAGVHGAVVYLLKKGGSHFDGAGTWAVTG